MLKRFVPLIIIILLVLCFFYKLAFTDLILARGDTYAYFYPYWDARDDALRDGEMPLWTNDLFMGVPMMANPQLGTLYPPNWLTIPLNAPDSIRISILIHVAWAFLGVYWLAHRSLGLQILPALVAGAIFALSGHIGAHVEQINQLQGLSWLPWLILLFDHARDKPRRFVPLLAIAWAMQLLSGHTQTTFISGVALVIYGVFVWAQGTHVISPLNPLSGSERGFKLRWRAFLPPLSLSKAAEWGPGGEVREVTSHNATKRIRSLLILLIAGILAVIIASPQLIPTQELISLSNRSGGLNTQEATAFSLNPFLFGRGMLPSYDAQLFGEYIGYLGVIGLGLAIIGILSTTPRRRVWMMLAFIGLLLAFGRHDPLYLPLASLPGFNLFRVPARWLVLFALGMSMLAGLGLQTITARKPVRTFFGSVYTPAVVTTIIVLLLAALTTLSNRAADEVDGAALPTMLTLVLWFVPLVAFIAITTTMQRVGTRRAVSLLALLAIGELWLASQYLPYNDLTDPAVYNDTRFAINQMRVYAQDQTPPGRLLSISGLLFDPGDRAALEQRWADMGISQRAARYAFTATKIQETIASNLPLTWDIASVDGFGGGVLPTLYYTQFTSLLLPEGPLRTVDGRLREVLAEPECRGACLPQDRWLDLMNVQYLLTDKVYDLVHEGIFYDTQFPVDLVSGETITLDDVPAFESDGFHILYACPMTTCILPAITFSPENQNAIELSPIPDENIVLDGLQLARYSTHETISPAQITITAANAMQLRAMTLVDNRTGDFVQLTPPGWKRIYSGDVKIYENLDVLPRAFVVHQSITVPDTYTGTEQALDIMRDPNFDPRHTVILSTNDAEVFGEVKRPSDEPVTGESTVTITEYSPTRIQLTVDAAAPGYLVLTDAFYPGWQAELIIDSIPPDLLRANVMFRAIPIHEGQSDLILQYHPTFSSSLPLIGLVIVLILLIIAFASAKFDKRTSD